MHRYEALVSLGFVRDILGGFVCSSLRVFFFEERRFFFFPFCLAAGIGCVCGRVVCGCEVWE